VPASCAKHISADVTEQRLLMAIYITDKAALKESFIYTLLS